MTTRYRLIYRGSRSGMFYSVDKTTGKRSSLETNDKAEALGKIAAMNQASQQPAMNLSLAKIYLRHGDPLVAERTWQTVLDEIIRTKTGENQKRWVPQSCLPDFRVVLVLMAAVHHKARLRRCMSYTKCADSPTKVRNVSKPVLNACRA